MSAQATAFIETREGQGKPYEPFSRLWFSPQESLDLYALTGLEGADPKYEVADLGWAAQERWPIELADVAITKLLKIEAEEATTLVDAYLAKAGRLEPRVEVIVRLLPRLGRETRLVFWLRN